MPGCVVKPSSSDHPVCIGIGNVALLLLSAARSDGNGSEISQVLPHTPAANVAAEQDAAGAP